MLSECFFYGDFVIEVCGPTVRCLLAGTCSMWRLALPSSAHRRGAPTARFTPESPCATLFLFRMSATRPDTSRTAWPATNRGLTLAAMTPPAAPRLILGVQVNCDRVFSSENGVPNTFPPRAKTLVRRSRRVPGENDAHEQQPANTYTGARVWRPGFYFPTGFR